MIGVLRYQSLFFPAAVLFLLVAVAIPDLNARKQPIQGKPALPGRDCQVPALKNWAPQEKWVWEQVCQGKIADFNKTKGYGGKLDPKKDKEWPSNRILRPAFLETILLHEHYRGALTRHGVCIIGAWFKQPLDLSNATLLHQLWLECSRFESHLDLSRAKTLCLLSLEGSVFNGTVNLAFGEFIKETNMVAASFASKLDMVGMQAGHLLMHGGAEFSEVDLRYAKIGGQVAMNGSKFRAKLNMHGMQAGRRLIHGGWAD